MVDKNKNLREALGRLRERLYEDDERSAKEHRGLAFNVPQRAELTNDMSRSDIRDRIIKVSKNDVGNVGVFVTACGIFAIGSATLFSAGDYAYNEKTGYHDLETDATPVRGVGLSMMALAVVLFLVGVRSNVKAERQLEESVDLMLDMREKYPEIPVDVDVKKMKRLLTVLPIIKEHLKESDRDVLDSLLRADKKLLQDDKWRDMATNIMSEHLKKHPKDLDLLMNAYRGVMTWDMAYQYATPHREY